MKKPLSQSNAARLLDLLCDDDTFREEFSNDPGVALAKYSLQQAATVGACSLTGQLASKQEFASLRSELAQAVSQRAMFTVPHFFEAGHVASSIRSDASERAA